MVILYVGTQPPRPELLAELIVLAGPECAVGYCPDWSTAQAACRAYHAAGTPVAAWLAAPEMTDGPEIRRDLKRVAPSTVVLTLPGEDGVETLDETFKKQLEMAVCGGRVEQDEISKKLNAAAIQRMLIEREAEKMSRRLTVFQNDLKNNLFIRSVLHTLINLLQVQLSLDKEQNAVIGELKILVEHLCAENTPPDAAACGRLRGELFPKLAELRAQTDANIHKSMIGYVKAVQRSLLGKFGFYTDRPASLSQAVERIHAKYKDILSGKKTGRAVSFRNELPDREIRVSVFDFAIITILENLMTNSLHKLMETERTERWIRVSVTEGLFLNERCLVLVWEDNGPGVPADRKQSIFTGDSDKIEEGDHGVGLTTVKISIESAGGFVREEGVPGEGARFLIGFPRPEKSS